MKSRFILKPVVQPTAPFQDTFTLMFIVGIPSSWRNQFTNYLYNLSAAGWCSHIRGIQAWAYVWVWIWNLLFWAIVLLTYIISPHGEVYLLENCVICCSLNMMLCIALASLSCWCCEGSWDVNWSYWKKCEYIVIIILCDVYSSGRWVCSLVAAATSCQFI